MGSQLVNDLHFLALPYMAQGHAIPLIDTAKMLAMHGVKITVVTNSMHAPIFDSVIARAKESGLPIEVVKLEFPNEKVGLPKDLDTYSVTSFESLIKYHLGIDLLEEQIEKLFEELSPRPNCIISDIKFACTFRIASKFRIPRVTFQVIGCISLLCMNRLYALGVLDKITSSTEPFVIPDFPHELLITSAQAPQGNPSKGTKWSEIMDDIRETDNASYGAIVNSFEELENDFFQEYKKVKGGKAWCFGPVSLCNKENLDKGERGGKASVGQHECLKWLDTFEPSSVIYACLGSTWNLPSEQLIELALGLEASNRPFIWAVRSEEIGKWSLESGYEERIKGRGLLIKGWAPQVVILAHPSLGCFLTHSGWNSVVEGACSGVPLLTWPLMGDHFIAEKLLVHVLEVGVNVLGDCIKLDADQIVKQKVMVKKEDIVRSIDKIFIEDEEAEKRRQRAKELQKHALAAPEKGGSSYKNVTEFIQDIMSMANRGADPLANSVTSSVVDSVVTLEPDSANYSVTNSLGSE